MPKVRAIKASKVQSVVQNFSEKFMKSPINELNCNLKGCMVSCSKRFFVVSHRIKPNTKKR